MYKDDGFFDDNYEDLYAPTRGEDPIKFCLKQIYELQMYIKYLHKIIPQKYKKSFPSHGENPFFSNDKFHIPEDPEELKKAKARMLNLSKKNSKSES